MNNKGQSLVLFVLILPVIVFVIALTIDSLFIGYQRNQIEGIIESNLVTILDKDIRDEEKILNFFNESIEGNNRVIVRDDIIYIDVSSDKRSLFANLLKIDIYNLDYHYCGNYMSKKINEKGVCE